MQYLRIIKCISIVVTIIVFGLIYIMSSQDSSVDMDIQKETTNKILIEDGSQKTSKDSEEIYVYVTGAVKVSGVYKVKETDRVCDVISLAGGFTEDADERSVNMARTVVDGEHIHICIIGETPSQTYGGLININSASKDELMTLPGIGESRALSIIKYRTEHGKFATIEDIMNVSGIKQAAFDKIKEYICVK